MDLFGLNRFTSPQNGAQPPQRGPGRYFAALWDNLGGLMGANLVCCAGFLPLALGVSLGVIYENFWLCLALGGLGGALAGVCWVPMLALGLQAFSGSTRGWLARWKKAALAAPGPAALAGGVLGLLGGAGLLIGRLAGAGLGLQTAPPALVWAALAVDGLLLALAAALLSAVFAWGRSAPKGGQAEQDRDPGQKPASDGPEKPAAPLFARAAALLLAAPGRVLAAAAALLAWCLGAVALFPVSVPFALLLGFWPPALLAAQLLLDPLAESFGPPAWQQPEAGRAPAAAAARAGQAPPECCTPGQRAEIFWRRRGPAILIAAAAVLLLAWGGSQLLIQPEPDLRAAVVRAEPLPDPVRAALEASLTERVGDRNDDGRAVAQLNDYTVVFDGTAQDPDRQTAGMTLLVSDLAAGDSAFYLVEDPDGFLALYADRVQPGSALRWADSPALASLDAGTYALLEDLDAEHPGQQLLAPLTLLPGLDADPALLRQLLEP